MKLISLFIWDFNIVVIFIRVTVKVVNQECISFFILNVKWNKFIKKLSFQFMMILNYIAKVFQICIFKSVVTFLKKNYLINYLLYI